MKKTFITATCFILAICLILLLAACSKPQATGQESPASSDTPTPGLSTTVPTGEYMDRCGFGSTYGTMVTDGKYLYYRRYGGEMQAWDIQRMDLSTKEIKTLVTSDAYYPAEHCINLFLDGGKLFFTLYKNPTTEELCGYDEATGAATRITAAKTILLAQGTIYLTDGGKLYSQPLNGNSRKELLDREPVDMAVSPQYTAILTDQNKIVLFKKDGTRLELDATLPEDEGKASGTYYWDKENPDAFGQIHIYADSLYYIAHVPGENGSGENLSMCRLDIASGTAERIFSVDKNFNITGFTMFAGMIYYTSREIPEELGGQVIYHLYQYDLNTGENRQLGESKVPFTGYGDIEYNAITLSGSYAFAWMLTQRTETGDGTNETYTLYRFDPASGAGEKTDESIYQYFYNGPPATPDQSEPNPTASRKPKK